MPFAALDLVELFFQRAGRTFVAVGKVFIDLGHLLGARLGGQPLANARSALARRCGREGAAGQTVQRMDFGSFGGGSFAGGGGRGIGLGGFGHESAEHKKLNNSQFKKSAAVNGLAKPRQAKGLGPLCLHISSRWKTRAKPAKAWAA